MKTTLRYWPALILVLPALLFLLGVFIAVSHRSLWAPGPACCSANICARQHHHE